MMLLYDKHCAALCPCTRLTPSLGEAVRVHGPEPRDQDILYCLDCNKYQAVGVQTQSCGLGDMLLDLSLSHLQEQFLHVKVKGSVRKGLLFACSMGSEQKSLGLSSQL